jgi:hypothetical protein
MAARLEGIRIASRRSLLALTLFSALLVVFRSMPELELPFCWLGRFPPRRLVFIFGTLVPVHVHPRRNRSVTMPSIHT